MQVKDTVKEECVKLLSNENNVMKNGEKITWKRYLKLNC